MTSYNLPGIGFTSAYLQHLKKLTMENVQSIAKRRNFLKQSITIALSFSAIPSMAGILKRRGFQQVAENLPLSDELVKEFVGAAHGTLPRVKEMLATEPLLVNACWDWGKGDYELAIGGAAHMGNRDIANYLLDNNARIDIFCAAMLGEKAVVQSLVNSRPNIVNVRGPHKYPLLYHVAISGDTSMADMLKTHLDPATAAAVCNRSVQAAANHGQASMVEWLFLNGANNPNTKNVLGKSPLQIAQEKGYNQVSMILKKYGAK
jgi:hypothetical protein